MATIAINRDTCIKCGRCAKICPANIFVQNNPKEEIKLIHPEFCIVCGHCVAACPTGSIIHGEFPSGKVHKINRALLPEPEQIMLLCRKRRSNRAFSTKPVPDKDLGMILEAAHRAPTASNKQEVEFTLITDPEKLHRLSELTIEVFDGIVKRLSNPFVKSVVKLLSPELLSNMPGLKMIVEEFRNGNDLILRGAKAVILINTPENNRFGCEDSNLAYQNGSLMAESLGIAQFYTGFVLSAIKQDPKRFSEFIGKGKKVHAGMALGIPEFIFTNYIDKKEIKITRL